MIPQQRRRNVSRFNLRGIFFCLVFMGGFACKPIVMNQAPGAPEAGKVRIQVADSLLNDPAPALRLSLIEVSKNEEEPEELDHLNDYEMDPGAYCFTVEAEHLKEKSEVQAVEFCFTAEAGELYQLDGVAENGGTILVYATNAPDYSQDRRTVVTLQMHPEEKATEKDASSPAHNSELTPQTSPAP